MLKYWIFTYRGIYYAIYCCRVERGEGVVGKDSWEKISCRCRKKEKWGQGKRGNCTKNASLWVITLSPACLIYVLFGGKMDLEGEVRRLIEMHHIYPCLYMYSLSLLWGGWIVGENQTHENAYRVKKISLRTPSPCSNFFTLLQVKKRHLSILYNCLKYIFLLEIFLTYKL